MSHHGAAGLVRSRPGGTRDTSSPVSLGVPTCTQALDSAVRLLERRLGALEAEEQLNPRPAPSSLAGVQDKVDALTRQQVGARLGAEGGWGGGR